MPDLLLNQVIRIPPGMLTYLLLSASAGQNVGSVVNPKDRRWQQLWSVYSGAILCPILCGYGVFCVIMCGSRMAEQQILNYKCQHLEA